MDAIKHIIERLPSLPGVYQFYDNKGNILYIGKAKDLKKRVSSYFSGYKKESYKTKVLASQVKKIEHIVVESEADALLLENNLIKNLQPKYNILLKDDKTFPWICIKNENFPRVFSTRSRIKDGSEYFGPYTSAYMVKTLLNLVKQLYKVRNCNLKLTHESITKKKFRACLEFHIGNCKAPCEGLQGEEDYYDSIKQIREILKGNLQNVLDYLNTTMLDFARDFKFEEADLIKQKLELLQNFKSKSTIVNPKFNNLDVFSFVEEENLAYVNFIKIIQGAIVQSHTVEISKKLDEKREDILIYAILDIREKVFSDSKDAIVPFEINNIGEIKFTVPQIGDKKKLLDLSERNAKQFAAQRKMQRIQIQDKFNKTNILEHVKKDLRLKNIPERIECFDNSNIQGSSPVAACVVFKNGAPVKKEYRHFHIKSVKGANDFASMREIVLRRYKRLLKEDAELPQLIIIDGGKGQLNAGVDALKELNLYRKIAILGIAKRLEELFFPGDPVPLYLDKNSKTLKLIQNIRNEAHRFGIAFHRKVRSKGMIENSINSIKGIGKKTVETIVKNYGSIENVKDLSIDEVAKLIGRDKAGKLFEYFRSEK